MQSILQNQVRASHNYPTIYTKAYSIICYHCLEITEPQCPSAEDLNKADIHTMAMDYGLFFFTK